MPGDGVDGGQFDIGAAEQRNRNHRERHRIRPALPGVGDLAHLQSEVIIVVLVLAKAASRAISAGIRQRLGEMPVRKSRPLRGVRST